PPRSAESRRRLPRRVRSRRGPLRCRGGRPCRAWDRPCSGGRAARRPPAPLELGAVDHAAMMPAMARETRDASRRVGFDAETGDGQRARLAHVTFAGPPQGCALPDTDAVARAPDVPIERLDVVPVGIEQVGGVVARLVVAVAGRAVRAEPGPDSR